MNMHHHVRTLFRLASPRVLRARVTQGFFPEFFAFFVLSPDCREWQFVEQGWGYTEGVAELLASEYNRVVFYWRWSRGVWTSALVDTWRQPQCGHGKLGTPIDRRVERMRARLEPGFAPPYAGFDMKQPVFHNGRWWRWTHPGDGTIGFEWEQVGLERT